MALTILILGLLFNVFVGTFVLVRSPKSKLNQAVFAMSLSFMAWYIANYFADMSSEMTLFWNRATFIGPIWLVMFADLFLVYLQHKSTAGKHYYRLLMPAAVFFSVFALTPYVISDVVPRLDAGALGGYDVVRSWGYIPLIIWLVFLLSRFTYHLLIAYFHATGALKQQLNTIAIGISLAIFVGLTTNVFAPIVMGNTTLAKLAPLTSVFVMGAFMIAIVRQRLFDIRFYVVRSVAYLATLSVLSGIFGLVVFGTARVFFDLNLSYGTQIYISVGTAIAALAFSSLKSLFDKITNSLFYRDAYDTQVLFDRLNRLLVSNTNITPLLKRSAEVLEDTFKAEFCYFAIKESDETGQRLIGLVPRVPNADDIALVREQTPKLHRKIIVTDDLEGSSNPLRLALQHNRIALLGRLTATTHTNNEGMGYLVLGARRSGNPYTTKDIQALETIVNELVIAVENSLRFEQIQHFNETLQENVSEATSKLRKTNQKLQDLDATKDEFITMASHQLRTPLTAVKGYLSMVLEGDAGTLNEQQRKLLQQSYASSQRMVYLIADLLNLSRLGTGKFVIDAIPTNLVDVVQAELDQLEETARSRDVILKFEYPEIFPTLMLDEMKIRQVVMNLIDNAIYYTPAGGTVTVGLVDKPASIEFIVRDTGIGVPRKEQRRLFTKFYRAENARQARPDGTGLGLFMAKKVVAAQEGAIIFESEEGKGSTFGFRFNKRSHAVSHDAPQDTSKKP